LTNGFSKKAENHARAVALHFVYYNFVWVHKSLRCRPRWRLASRRGCEAFRVSSH
jgi:hypothetical protein